MTAPRRAGSWWIWVVALVVFGVAATAFTAARPLRHPSRRPEHEALLPAAGSSPAASLRRVSGDLPPVRQGLDCDRCHGELELLRQQAKSLDRARQLNVARATVAGSAHRALDCVDCHTGFKTYPHASRGAHTATCASCHAAEDHAWQLGVHAGSEGKEAVNCADCHGVHDVRPITRGDTTGLGRSLSGGCLRCHESQRMPAGDPHFDRVACVNCHAPHAVRPVSDSASLVAAEHQPATCGACHDSIAARWQTDVHGDRQLAERVRAERGATRAAAQSLVACTSCHGAHGMVSPRDSAFGGVSVEQCATCHGADAGTYFGTYHGKATALGSRVVATCADCHGAHDIYPPSDARSRVSADRLVQTCGQCHDHARPEFVKYDSHPDPLNRHRNAAIFYSFWFMNALLLGVVVVFGAHTGLWWLRLYLDRRRGGEQPSGGEQ